MGVSVSPDPPDRGFASGTRPASQPATGTVDRGCLHLDLGRRRAQLDVLDELAKLGVFHVDAHLAERRPQIKLDAAHVATSVQKQVETCQARRVVGRILGCMLHHVIAGLSAFGCTGAA